MHKHLYPIRRHTTLFPMIPVCRTCSAPLGQLCCVVIRVAVPSDHRDMPRAFPASPLMRLDGKNGSTFRWTGSLISHDLN